MQNSNNFFWKDATYDNTKSYKKKQDFNFSLEDICLDLILILTSDLISNTFSGTIAKSCDDDQITSTGLRSNPDNDPQTYILRKKTINYKFVMIISYNNGKSNANKFVRQWTYSTI